MDEASEPKITPEQRAQIIAEGLEEIAELDRKIAAAKATIQRGTDALAVAEAERAKYPGVASATADSAPPSSRAGHQSKRSRKQLADDAVAALKTGRKMMTRGEIATAINEPTNQESKNRLSNVLQSLAKNDPPLIKKDGANQGAGSGWTYIG